MTKADSTLEPFAELGGNIFGHEDDLRRPTDELVLRGPGTRRDEGEHCAAVGRRYSDPALAGLKARIEGQLESKLIQVEPQASLLISHEDPNSVESKVRVESVLPFLSLRARSGPSRPRG
jgi:hypothetical protein